MSAPFPVRDDPDWDIKLFAWWVDELAAILAGGGGGGGGGDMFGSHNLSELTDVALAREALQLGNAATADFGVDPGTIAAGDAARIVGALQISNALAELTAVADVARASIDVYSTTEVDDAIAAGGGGGGGGSVLLVGRAGGQVVEGGTAAGENLTLGSTAHATKGKVIVLDPMTVGTIANTTIATGAAHAAQNVVISDSIHQVADPTQVREGTPLNIEFDHILDYTAGTLGILDLGPRTSLPLRPANWSGFNKTHVTSGSNGYNVTAPAGWTTPGVLNVTDTTKFDASGAIRITMGGSVGGTIAVLNYTGKTANTFTGCTFVSGTGTIATGSTIQGGATGIEMFPRGYVTLSGTTTYAHDAAIYSDAVDFISLRVHTNPQGVAKNIVGKNVFINNSTYIARGATINGVPPGFGGFYPSLNTYGNLGFEDQPVFTTDASTGGQLNNCASVSMYSGPLFYEHTHATWVCGLYIDDANAPGNSFGDGLGVIDTHVGIQINPLVTAATGIAINIGNPDPSVTPLFRILGTGQVLAFTGVFGGTASGQLFEISSTTHANKGVIALDASSVQIGASSYTQTNALGPTNFHVVAIPNLVTMNSSGGGAGTGNGYTGFSHTNTVVFQAAGNIFAGAVGYSDAGTIKNTTSTSLALGPLYSMFAAPTIQADDATVTSTGYTTVYSSPITSRITSGSLSIIAMTAVWSDATVGANTTVTTRTGLLFNDATGSGTVTNQIAIDIGTLAKGGTLNIGIRNKASTLLGTSGQLSISSAGAISSSADITTSGNLSTSGSGTLVVTGTSTVAGGLYGSSASGGNLLVNSTSNATKGYVNLVDEVRIKATDQTFTAAPQWFGIVNTYTANITGTNTINSFINIAPTVIFQQSGFGFGAAIGISHTPTYKNLSSVAANFGTLFGISSGATITADTQTGLTGSMTDFSSGITTSVASAGSMTLSALVNYKATVTVGTGTTVTALTGFQFSAPSVVGTVTTMTGVSIANATGAGTVTTLIGLDIVALTKGGTNIGIRCKSLVQFGSTAQCTVDTSGNFATSGTAATGALTVTGAATVSGNIGFNGKTAQALTSFAAPTGTLLRSALANPTYTTTGGTGVTAGAFDTAAHRDNVISDLFTLNKTVQALITDLRANGVIG